MPANKDFQRRITILDECLRRRQRQWTVNDLLEEVNSKLGEHFGKSISIRSIYADIQWLNQEMDAPIEKVKSGNNTYYRYADPHYSIRNIPVREEEINLLKDAVELLSSVHGFPIAEEMLAVVSRPSIIQFEKNGLAAGVEHLPDCFEAIKEKCVLKIEYQPFGKEVICHSFNPYLLKEYRNRWFLIGRIDTNEQVTTLALDRIRKLKPISKAFIDNNLFDPDTYFDHVIGVTVPEAALAEEVVLKIENALYPYIQTKPIHDTQRLISDGEGNKCISVCVINNHEFRSLLLSYGPGVKVVSPPSLKDHMKHLFTEGATAYNS